MRNPERIPIFMFYLTALWVTQPDLRFFQLVEWLGAGRDRFNQEDDLTLDTILEKLEAEADVKEQK